MASAYDFDIALGGEGAIFALSGSARRDRRQTFGSWEAELRKDSAYDCVRGPVSNLNRPLADVVGTAHGIAQDLLDIVAVEERTALLIAEPQDNVVWRTGPHGLKLRLTSSITMTAEMTGITAVVTNAAGEVLPDPPYMPPQHHFAYRYFRYSQAASNVFDGYRNMFLALEALLDYVDAKQPNEVETEWLKRALGTAQARGLSLSAFARPGSANPVDVSFAKSSSAWARRHPGSAGAGRWPGLRQGAGILTPPTRARTHRIRDGSRESGQATRGGLRTFSGTEGQKTEEAGLRGLAEVAVVQAADFGKLHDPPRRGKLDRPEVGCVLVEREMGTCLMIIGKGSRRRRSPDTLVVRAVPGGRAERRGRAWRG